jgi:2-haloacid dehalogenase
MKTVLAFDVNETLLDLRALDPAFEALFGTAALRPRWFATMLQLSFTGGLTGRYTPFAAAQHSALRMLAAQQGVVVSDTAVDEAVGTMSRLPAHPEVPAALERFAAGGLPMVALVNSSAEVGEAQLRNAGVRHLFDAVLSSDAVGAPKPAPAPYHAAASRYGVVPHDVLLVAAHGWDITGAHAAGCRTAFVARPGAALDPAGPVPDVSAPDLTGIADAVLPHVDRSV